MRYKSRQVLKYLAQHKGKVVTRAQLVQAAWDVELVSDENVAQCIADIRRVLSDTDKRIVETIPRQGYRFASAAEPCESILSDQPSAEPKLPGNGQAAATRTRTFIAVLPFDNLGVSGVRAPALLAALAEAIITYLARYPELTVFSRLADPSEPTAHRLGKIAAEQRADYVVTGGVQSDGTCVRISLRLVSTKDHACVWVDQVELSLSEFFNVTPWIGRHVANAVGAKIIDMAQNRMDMGDISAMLIENAARSRMLRFQSREAFQRNVLEQETALKRFPDAPWGHFGQSLALRVGIDAGWIIKDIDAARSRAETLAARALAIAPDNYLVHYAIGRTLVGRGEIRSAIAAFERAAKINPSSTLVVTGMIDPYLNLDDTARALELINMAERINPLRNRELAYKKGRIYWQMGEHKKALKAMESIPCRTAEQAKLLAVIYHELGNSRAARNALIPYMAENPDWSISRECQIQDELHTPQRVRRDWLSGLTKASMPA
ncbi:winged helix-turn-helix domain-containing protein [Sulfitobacter sp. F26169L]|uniref:winged helix-turn-helix domain-containing protein n=1 Tax=Sulfitobacter sp. F26169L TaxID=2996015 RepID=UPI002260D548|nr:winged helix-turn-helix domain-containing protein [Sulfitobacter sp. F26169L]MCX7567693.1 winged helix-turn-helix domain-containing protein [Sulfitobacter sp. F26169L]